MKKIALQFSEDRLAKEFKILRTRVYREIRLQGTRTIAGPSLWLKGLALFFVALGSYCLLINAPLSGPAALFCGTVFGVATLLFALNVGHDAAHNSFSSSRTVNNFLLFLPFAVLGVDPQMWRERHLRSHHCFPNIDSCDADIDENPFIRLSPHQPQYWWHRFQSYYAWVLYLAVALHATWIQDVNYMRRQSLANMSDWSARTPAWTKFLLTKLVHVLVVYAAPLSLLPFAWPFILAGILLIQSLLSILFILPLIGTHFSSDAVFLKPKEGCLGHSYVTHQILTSVDWRPFSKIANGLFGGLNAHTAHHLFPNISHTHYHWISREIREFCLLNGLHHNIVGLRQAIANHYRFLRDMAIN